MELQEIQRLFPSEDGNKEQQQYLLDLRNRLIKEVDSYKNPNKSILGETKNRDDDFYRQLVEQSIVL